MKSNEMRKYVIGFLVGFCMVFILGARMWYVDGHCQSSLTSVSRTEEVYLAITNTSTGKTIVHRLDRDDFGEGDEIAFDAVLINQDQLMVNARR